MTNWKKLTSRSKIKALSLILLSLFLSACEKETELPAKTVAAVDDVALSDRQLNFLMKIHGAGKDEKNKIVRNWIEEQIFLREAEANGLLEDEKFKAVAEENRKELAKAFLAEAFFNALEINVSDYEIRDYYEKHKGEFILFEEAFVMDKALFENLESALEFRKKAVASGWDKAVFSRNPEIRGDVFVLKHELSPVQAMRVTEFLSEGEPSPVIKDFDGTYFVFRIKRKLAQNDFYPLKTVYDEIKTRVEIEKRAARFAEYKKEIYGKHKIEIYGEINE